MKEDRWSKVNCGRHLSIDQVDTATTPEPKLAPALRRSLRSGRTHSFPSCFFYCRCRCCCCCCWRGILLLLAAEFSEFDERELEFDEMTKSWIAEDFGAGLEVFHVLGIGRIDRFTSDVGRQGNGSGTLLCRRWGWRGRRSELTLDVALKEGRGVLVDIEREAVVGTLPVVAMHTRGHAVIHDVFADAFQLVLRAVLQVEESVQADFTTLIKRYPIDKSLPLSTIVFSIRSSPVIETKSKPTPIGQHRGAIKLQFLFVWKRTVRAYKITTTKNNLNPSFNLRRR